MKRLTTDAPKNNLESALNLFYAKDGEAWVLGGGPEPNYVPDTIAMRAIQQISRRAKAQNSPVPALLRRIGVSRELFWRWKQNKNDISACYLQQMALDGYDVVYILTGKRNHDWRNNH